MGVTKPLKPLAKSAQPRPEILDWSCEGPGWGFEYKVPDGWN